MNNQEQFSAFYCLNTIQYMNKDYGNTFDLLKKP